MDGARIAEYADLLRKVEIFADLDRVTLSKLAARLEPVPAPDGATLFHQGDPPDALYVVCRGSFGIFCAAPGGFGEARLATLTRGEPIGEMALLTGEGRSATVRVEGDGEVLRLDRAHFIQLVRQDPSVALAIAATLSRRLRATDAAFSGRDTDPRVDDGAPSGSSVGPPAFAAPGRVAAVNLPARPRRRPGPTAVGLGLAGLALGVGWATPPPLGLTPAGWHALATLLAIVPLFSLGRLPDGVVALAVATVWVLGDVAPPQVALGGFATASWLLVVSILAIGAAVGASGLLYRVALWAVAHARGGFPGQVGALAVAGLFIGAVIPSPTGRVSLVAPATTEIADALGYPPRSRPAVGLAMAVLIGFGQMVALFLTSSSITLLAYTLLPDSARVGLNWVTWTARALPTHAMIFIGLLAAAIWLYRPAHTDERPARGSQRATEALALQRALLGTPSRQERTVAAGLLFMFVGFASQPIHGVSPVWVAVATLALLATAGVVTADTLRAINWSFVLLFGVLASMPGLFTNTALDRWLAQLAGGTVHVLAAAPVLFVGALTLLCYGLSLVLRWDAAVPLLTIALVPVAGAVGIDPWIVAIIALVACNGFWVPYQSTMYLALYHGTGGYLFSHAQARPLAVAYGVLTLLALCASVPLWQALGLL